MLEASARERFVTVVMRGSGKTPLIACNALSTAVSAFGKRNLILVPHPDDEMALRAAAIARPSAYS
jgi:hypothetical protein